MSPVSRKSRPDREGSRNNKFHFQKSQVLRSPRASRVFVEIYRRDEITQLCKSRILYNRATSATAWKPMPFMKIYQVRFLKDNGLTTGLERQNRLPCPSYAWIWVPSGVSCTATQSLGAVDRIPSLV